MANADSNTEMSPNTSLKEFLEKFEDNFEDRVKQFIESIAYDDTTRTDIIYMQEGVKNMSEISEKSREQKIDTDDEKVIQLSEKFKEKFPKLLKSFEEWKPAREKLIEILSNSVNKLGRNFSIVSIIRILTSAADIIGTIVMSEGKPDNSPANFAMDQASTFGLLSLFTEKVLAQRMLKDVKMAFKLDQELFKEIVNWFKQTEELDNAVKKIFPYGIDPDLTKKISESASKSKEECNKILFMSVIASNVKENVYLFKDEAFLNKANTFANSEAGKMWYHKLALNCDPIWNHCLKSELNEDIHCLLKTSTSDDLSLSVDAMRTLSSKVRMKNILNVITIMSAVKNLLLQNKPEEYDILQELWEKTKAELKGIEEIVDCLRPANVDNLR